MILLLQVLTATAVIAGLILLGMFAGRRVMQQRISSKTDYQKTDCQGGCGHKPPAEPPGNESNLKRSACHAP